MEKSLIEFKNPKAILNFLSFLIKILEFILANYIVIKLFKLYLLINLKLGVLYLVSNIFETLIIFFENAIHSLSF